METLEHPDPIYLSAAQGWFELGNFTEAAAELDQIRASAQEHPQVLELRWQIVVQGQRWSEGLQVAEVLCRIAPEQAFGWIHRSYCLHELKRTQEAWDILLPVAERFPNEWLLCYNLACYACQLHRLEEARTWFCQAMDLGDPAEIKQLAAQDPDLRPLLANPE